MRELSKKFINDLLNGDLKDILKIVKSDNSLDLEIRGDYINIYYRGGNILKITEEVKSYKYDFEYKYIIAEEDLAISIYGSKYVKGSKKREIEIEKENRNWLKYFTLTKQVMDMYITSNNKEEREYQQLVVRENNYSSLANGTDYFIIDIEYDNHQGARFDIVAIEWMSTSEDRKLLKSYKPKLVVLEMKYGDGALNGAAGMNEHIKDFKDFTSIPSVVDSFKAEMLKVFEQKRKLGLIPCLKKEVGKTGGNDNKIEEFADDIDFGFLLANHDPASIKLLREINEYQIAENDINIEKEISFVTSTFMGYGLFKNSVYSTSAFLDKFMHQIYEGKN